MIEGCPPAARPRWPRAAQPGRRDLREEQGDAEGGGHGQQQGDEGGHQGAVDGHQGAEFLGADIPFGRGDEVQAEGHEGMATAPEGGRGGADQYQQYQQRGGKQQPAEPDIGAGIPADALFLNGGEGQGLVGHGAFRLPGRTRETAWTPGDPGGGTVVLTS